MYKPAPTPPHPHPPHTPSPTLPPPHPARITYLHFSVEKSKSKINNSGNKIIKIANDNNKGRGECFKKRFK